MWIITTTGFYSAVEHRADPEKIMVRARVKADLERLREKVDFTFRIETSPAWADYAYRTTIGRAEWEAACAELAADVDYDNFKNAVAARRGKERANVYMSVWAALYRLQPWRPSKKKKGKGKKNETGTLSRFPFFEGTDAARYLGSLNRESDGETGCLECGTFLLAEERKSDGGTGVCDLCDGSRR